MDAAPEASRPPSVPDTAVSAHDFAVLVRQAATERTLSMRGDKLLRFGEQIDIKVIARRCRETGNDSEIFQPPDRGLPRNDASPKSVADFGIGVRRFSPGAID